MIVLSVMAMAILLAASITLIALVMRSFVRDIALYPYKSPALSVVEAGRSQRELQAWRENQAEELEKLVDRHTLTSRDFHVTRDDLHQMTPNPFDTGIAEFIGGPLNGQIHAMSEALPTFYWAQALPMDWVKMQEDADPATAPQIDEYTYERQFFFSSTGNAVYICRD